MAADHDTFDLGDVGTERKAQEIAETCAVESATHADDAFLGQTAGLVDKICHGVHGVRHADHDSVGRVLEHIVHHALDDTGVHADKLLAGHAGLTGDTRCDDNDITAFGHGIVVGYTHETGVDVEDAGRLHDIHGLAFRNALFDVEQNDFVGHLVCYEYISTCCAYISGAYYCYF